MKVTGFSYFIYDAGLLVIVRYYYDGIAYCYYYIALGPASATGNYYCKNS